MGGSVGILGYCGAVPRTHKLREVRSMSRASICPCKEIGEERDAIICSNCCRFQWLKRYAPY